MFVVPSQKRRVKCQKSKKVKLCKLYIYNSNQLFMFRNYILSIVCLLCTVSLFGQSPKQLSAPEIYEELEKFNFLGTALYVAAHPDDENTRLISYLSNGLHARTAYLSLTRGDGGQNLIGTEIRELLGVIRSQELQMARATDGGQQFFTRANDFGYSKHPDETLEFWDKDKVMEDILYVIRTFKPDVIVNRFDHRTPGRTHGHHTSSAMLSVEAFDLAADPKAYPEQAKKHGTWQVTRQFMNTSWWFYGSRENFDKADKSNMISVDAGIYYPVRGISNGEISSLARSKHRSQGFGSSGARGSYQEYLELLNGSLPENKENLFDGINTTWTRVKGGQKIKDIMDDVLANFNFKNPSEIVPQLLQIKSQLSSIQNDHWKDIKSEHLDAIITACLGMHIEASTEVQQCTRGDSIDLTYEVTFRSPSNSNCTLESVRLNQQDQEISEALEANTQNKWFKKIGVASDAPFSNPYWLNETGTLGTYKVEEEKLRTMPQSPSSYVATFNFDIDGQNVAVTRDVNYRYVDPAIGEIRQPFVVIPEASVKFSKELYLFGDGASQKFDVIVKSGKENLKGRLQLNVPNDWKVEPAFVDIEIPLRGQEQNFSFNLTPPNKVSEAFISAVVKTDNETCNQTLINIDYDHIPLQTVLRPAESKIVRVPLVKGGTNIAYIMGAGDKVPESLTNVGYSVSEIDIANLNTTNLNQYDAVVIGIRAYNTKKDLKLYNQILWDYAHDGGTLVVQYNTSRRLNFDMLAPYDIKLSRKRVTDEVSNMDIINPNHIVVNSPNKITDKDFESWVQERGLYFAEEWGPEFDTIIACNDKGEDPLQGSLLIAPHGKGHFVYTSISWFRQLPAGVPGAYRFFANILALSDSDNDRP